VDDAEERLAALGISIDDFDFGREDEPDVIGCLLIQRLEQGLKIRIGIRPGTTGERRASYAEWAASRIARFDEHGPEPDGWKARSDMDDGWQLWAREQLLPDFD
jgi:hypothetical protein